MSIRGFRSLWIRLQIKDKHLIPFPFPFSIAVLKDLLESILDLLIIISPFINERTSPYAFNKTAKELTIQTLKLLNDLNFGESFDLVDVSTDEVKISIKVR
ncbi:MAG: hypothetical protein PWP30_1798 [Eubacteriaceae bacterium]|jgi:hypothetical protein|nr:hypothetical protein [Eubacteriaceae bacterium]MDK2935223.1 hypothetical protein [Eubacteriaceae bacterium]